VRLNSWKEIAAFFDKDIRTVRRWEADRALPVHRLPGAERSGVFAYVSELQGWLHEASSGSAERTDPDPDLLLPIAEIELPLLDAQVPTTSFDPSPPRATATWKIPAYSYLVLALLVSVMVAAILWHRLTTKELVHSTGAAPVVVAKQPRNPEAQDLYLQGLYYWNLRTDASLNQAVDLFTQSIVHDPTFAPAFARLADSYLLLREYGHLSDAEAFPRALAASSRALALDNTSPEAHRTYAFLLNYWLWDFPAAEREFQRSIELDPGQAQTHLWFATSLYSAGRFQDAVHEVDIARRLQPEAISVLADRGLLLQPVDPHAALVDLLAAQAAAPDFPKVHEYLSDLYLINSDFAGYLREGERAADLSKRHDLMTVLIAAGKQLDTHGSKAMLQTLAEGYAKLADRRAVDDMTPAYFYNRLGETDHALTYMSTACRRHEVPFLRIDSDPAYRELHGNEQFQLLVADRRTPTDLANIDHVRELSSKTQ
jgi:tetratricopeptide (TPR) repeat protein